MKSSLLVPLYTSICSKSSDTRQIFPDKDFVLIETGDFSFVDDTPINVLLEYGLIYVSTPLYESLDTNEKKNLVNQYHLSKLFFTVSCLSLFAIGLQRCSSKRHT